MTSGNRPTEKAKRARTPALCPIAAAIHEGWEDRRAGRGYPSDFDARTPSAQNNYEAGRRLAASIAPHGSPPKWPRNRLFPTNAIPFSARDAFQEENRLTTLRDARTL